MPRILGFRFSLKSLLRIRLVDKKKFINDYVYNNYKSLGDKPFSSNRFSVCLTSYGTRILDIGPTLNSLLCQTYNFRDINVFLSKKDLIEYQFFIQKWKLRGIMFHEVENYGPHTKLLGAFDAGLQFPLITVDDDMIYPVYFNERLTHAHEENPAVIHFFRGHRIQIGKNGKWLPYSQWLGKAEGCSLLNFPTGVGGILYPKNPLPNEFIDMDKILRLCRFADDVWFKIGSYALGIECNLVSCDYDRDFVFSGHNQQVALSDQNNDNGLNDVQIVATRKFFNI